MKKGLIIILLTILSTISFARMISGSGRGDSAEKAKEAALRDISQQIQVKVISEFSKEETVAKDNSYSASKSSKVKLTSANDLLGVDFIVNEIKGVFIVEAFIDESTLPLYEFEIKNLIKSIELNVRNSENSDDFVFKKNYLAEARDSFEKLDAYRSVAVILGSEKTYEITFSKAYIINEIEKIDRVFEQKKVIYIQVIDEFDEEINNKYLIKEIKKMLTTISRKNPDTFRLTNNPDKKNVSFTVNVDSFFAETTPPVFYNKKQISNESYTGDVSLTFIIFNELTKSRIASFSVSGSAKSFLNEANAIDKSVRKIMIDSSTKNKIQEVLIK